MFFLFDYLQTLFCVDYKRSKIHHIRGVSDKMKFLSLWCLLIMSASLLTGCGAKFQDIPAPDQFAANQGEKIGLVWMLWPQEPGPDYQAKHYCLGQMGLLDIAIVRAFAHELEDALSKNIINDLIEQNYLRTFTPAFEDVGFSVKVNPTPYCVKKFRLSSNELCTNEIKQIGQKLCGVYATPQFEPVYDYKPIFDELDVDYLLMIDIVRHGTGRNYYAGVPTSPPKGVTTVFMFLVARNTMDMVSKRYVSVVEPAVGAWDEPPEYTNLMQASRDSFEAALDDIFIDIFKQAP